MRHHYWMTGNYWAEVKNPHAFAHQLISFCSGNVRNSHHFHPALSLCKHSFPLYSNRNKHFPFFDHVFPTEIQIKLPRLLIHIQNFEYLRTCTFVLLSSLLRNAGLVSRKQKLHNSFITTWFQQELTTLLIIFSSKWAVTALPKAGQEAQTEGLQAIAWLPALVFVYIGLACTVLSSGAGLGIEGPYFTAEASV